MKMSETKSKLSGSIVGHVYSFTENILEHQKSSITNHGFIKHWKKAYAKVFSASLTRNISSINEEIDKIL